MQKETPVIPIRSVGRRRVSDDIAEQLSTMITGGRLPVGAKLPTEAELVRDFGAGRSAVREAIAQLREAGLVESRHGVGAFVCSPVAATGFKIDPQTLSSLQTSQSRILRPAGRNCGIASCRKIRSQRCD